MMTNQNSHTERTFDSTDIEQNKTMAGLAYILFFLPLIACKDSAYGRFHANQGLLLLILSIVGSIALSVVSGLFLFISWRLFWISSFLYGAFGLVILILVVMGLINGLNGKAKELPIIGGFRIIK